MNKKKFIYYIFVNSISLITSIIIIPIYTLYFSPIEIGQFDIFLSLSTFFSSFFFMEIWIAVHRFSTNKMGIELDNIISNILFLLFILLLIFTFIFFVFVPLFLNYYIYIYFFTLSLLLQFFYQYYSRSIDDEKSFLISSVAISFVNLLSLFILARISLGIEAILISGIISRILTVFLMEIRLKLLKKFRFIYINKKLFMELIIFSFPFLINSFFYFVMNYANRFFLTYYLGFEQNGLISIVFKFVSVMNVILFSFNLIWQDLSSKFAGNNLSKSYFSKTFDNFLVFLSFTILFFLILSYFSFNYIVDVSFESSKFFIPIYFSVAFFASVNTFLGQTITAFKQTKSHIFSSFFGALANIIFLLLFAENGSILIFPFASIFGYIANIIFRYIKLSSFLDFSVSKKILVNLTLLLFFLLIPYFFNLFTFNILYFLILIFIDYIFNYKTINELLLNFLNFFKHT
jgi:O-antigen/teichoic acid export membrane protein